MNHVDFEFFNGSSDEIC